MNRILESVFEVGSGGLGSLGVGGNGYNVPDLVAGGEASRIRTAVIDGSGGIVTSGGAGLTIVKLASGGMSTGGHADVGIEFACKGGVRYIRLCRYGSCARPGGFWRCRHRW